MVGLKRDKMTDKIFETKRLILRQWREDDIPDMFLINQNAIVMEHFPGLKTYDETEKFVHANIHLYERNEPCLYAVELKDSGEFIGFVGLLQIDFNLPFVPAVEILWRLGSEYWGKGYAFEAATVVRDYAFNILRLKELVSFTVSVNTRSINLMEKLGFIHEPYYDFEHPRIAPEHKLSKHVLYRLKNEILLLKKTVL